MRLARLAHNDEFVRALQSVNNRIHYVRWIDMKDALYETTEAEHRHIVDLLRRRDPVAAELEIRRHIGRRMDQIIESVRKGFAEIYMRQPAEAL